MRIPSSIALRVSELVLRRRWHIMFLISLVVLVVEVSAHFGNIEGQNSLVWDLTFEVGVLGITLPLLGGFTLTMLNRVRDERSQADQQREISRKLATVADWDQLTIMLVDLPKSILPIVSSSLYIYNAALGRFEQVAEWHAYKVAVPVPPAALQNALQKPRAVADDHHNADHRESGGNQLLGPYYCRTCAMAQDSAIRSLVPCRYVDTATTEYLNSYCLPLVHGDQPIALLHFSLSREEPLTVDQMRFLNNVAPAMALAVEAARPQRSAAIQAQATEAERHRIAQELHDSLAQNIAYLRLKLDLLTGEDALREIAAVHQQLEQMRNVADQAYQQVRGTLVRLRPDGSPDVRAALLKLAKSFDERAGFKVYVSTEGTPFALAQEQQVLNIVQEALANVEKHARAKQVNIRLQWAKDNLQVTVADDGHGFDLESIKSNGHFGLSIMRERAQAIGADLTIKSSIGQGTRITLSIPGDARIGGKASHNTPQIPN